MNKKFAIFLLVCLTNAWIWRLLGSSPLLGLGLIILSFLLVFKLKIPSLVLLAVLGTFLLTNTFDTNLLYVSPLENDRLENRHEYYAQGLGKIYRNRIGVYLHYNISPYAGRFLKNLSYNLDPNLYFFANHPRERVGVIEFEKFSFVLLPFFIVGLITLLSGSFNFLIFYFAASLLVSAFAFPGYDLGPVLLFPFIVAVLNLGVLRIFRK